MAELFGRTPSHGDNRDDQEEAGLIAPALDVIVKGIPDR
jgi:hypothetical protein